MKTKNKKVIALVVITIVIVILGLLYFFLNSRNENRLTLSENKWIDSNKYNVVDVALINDIPVLSYNGSGVAYDYIKFLENKYSLKFNVVTYKLDNDMNYQYKLEIKDSKSENDIVLYEDDLVLVTKNNYQYNDVSDINNIKIGVLSSDRNKIYSYLNNSTIELVSYDTYSDLMNSMPVKNTSSTEEETTIETAVDGVIIPKTIFTKNIVENDYKISFHFSNLNKYFVISTNGSTELNSIMKKGYNIWKESDYEKSYNNNLLANYFNFKKVSDYDQKRLQSKNYEYGFIEYGIYNHLSKNKISGFNELILKDFNKFSGLSIKYTKYNSISKLLQDFYSNKLDFIMNVSNINNDSYYNTIGIFNKELVVVSGINNNSVIDSISSLSGKEVLTIKDSYIEGFLASNGIKAVSYNNLEDLTTGFSENDILLIELENYNYYKTSAFKDCKINYILNTNEKYGYIINNSTDNDVFEELFNFYLEYIPVNEIIYSNYNSIAYQNSNIQPILVIIIVILSIYLFVDASNHFKYMVKSLKKNKKIKLSKEDKIKYIDQLTSLKNRAYLNSRIESWDESEIYPQTVIVIDLNNISYINDNYGREEGDKVITEAANILIQHQLQNSEIIRTDGNEFLIYLVGYTEKQVIAYLRRLNKELKGLSHGFGAASGYSVILDAIKTFDDAVNEATLDMKNNKEDIDY